MRRITVSEMGLTAEIARIETNLGDGSPVYLDEDDVASLDEYIQGLRSDSRDLARWQLKAEKLGRYAAKLKDELQRDARKVIRDWEHLMEIEGE